MPSIQQSYEINPKTLNYFKYFDGADPPRVWRTSYQVLKLTYSYLNKTAGAEGRWEIEHGCSAVTKADTMKVHAESEESEDLINSGKEEGFAAAIVESDTKKPGERRDAYRTMIWHRRYIHTRTHTHLICASPHLSTLN